MNRHFSKEYIQMVNKNTTRCSASLVIQFRSVTQSYLPLCDPVDCSTPGFPVHHQFLEFVQTHVHRVSEAILTTSFSIVPFSSCLQSFPASGSFPMSQLFTSGGQRVEASASASVLPMNIQDWFSLGLTGLILQSKGLSKSLFRNHSSKASILQCSDEIENSNPLITVAPGNQPPGLEWGTEDERPDLGTSLVVQWLRLGVSSAGTQGYRFSPGAGDEDPTCCLALFPPPHQKDQRLSHCSFFN